MNLIDVVKGLVNETLLSISCKIELLENEVDFTYRFSVPCKNTYWISECMPLYNGVVVSVVRNQYFDIKFSEAIAVGEFNVTLPKPTFVHGTVPFANLEIKQDCLNSPICYLWEIFTAQYQNKFSTVDYIGQRIRLFFLSDYSQDDLTTDDHYNRCIYPMEQMALYFVYVMKKSKFIDVEYLINDKFDIINRVKVGDFKGATGNNTGLFARNLSGVELVVNIPIKKLDYCDC